MSKLVYGVGINNKAYPALIFGKPTKEYSLWKSILQRCYDYKVHAKYPTYINCATSDNFKYYDYFYKWCHNQIGFNLDGWDIDKDILIKGNKIYSEYTCVFVPSEINTFFTDSGNARGLFPVGVHFRKSRGKYNARCRVNGNKKYLGSFATPEQAHACYKTFKEVLCKELATKWRDQIDPRVYDAMMVWSV